MEKSRLPTSAQWPVQYCPVCTVYWGWRLSSLHDCANEILATRPDIQARFKRVGLWHVRCWHKANICQLKLLPAVIRFSSSVNDLGVLVARRHLAECDMSCFIGLLARITRLCISYCRDQCEFTSQSTHGGHLHRHSQGTMGAVPPPQMDSEPTHSTPSAPVWPPKHNSWLQLWTLVRCFISGRLTVATVVCLKLLMICCGSYCRSRMPPPVWLQNPAGSDWSQWPSPPVFCGHVVSQEVLWINERGRGILWQPWTTIQRPLLITDAEHRSHWPSLFSLLMHRRYTFSSGCSSGTNTCETHLNGWS